MKNFISFIQIIILFSITTFSTTVYGQWEPLRFFQEDEADVQVGSISMNQKGDVMAAGFARSAVSDTSTTALGRVVIYKEIDGEWSQLGNDIKGDVLAAQLGRGIKLNQEGNRILISQDFVSNNSTNGAYKVFELDDTNTWNQLGNTIEMPSSMEARSAANSLDISATGDRIAVLSGLSFNPFNIEGEVLVYDLVDNEWQQVGQTLTGETESDFFGSSLALSADGKRLAISASGDKTAIYGDEPVLAYVKIYDLIDDSWQEMARISNEATVTFSTDLVKMNSTGNVITISSNDFDPSQESELDPFSIQQVRVFETVDGNDWTLKGDPIVNPFNVARTGGGEAEISDDGLTVGVSYTDIRGSSELEGAGQVEVFKFIDNNWQLVDQPIIVGNEFQTVLYATELAMNGEGDRITVGNLGWVPGKLGGIMEVYENANLLSTPSFDKTQNFNLYPNPSTNDFTLNFNQSFKAASVTISDLSGKIVYAKSFVKTSPSEIKINHDLVPGLYVTTITVEDQNTETYTQKLQVR